MSKQGLGEDEIQHLAAEIQNSPKYRDINLPAQTLLDLIAQESVHYKKIKDIRQAVKKKIHTIVAAYLGDPDYNQAEIALQSALAQGGQAITDFCLQMLNSHASTKERVPILAEFYERLFSAAGETSSILDLACGLNPFALAWMGIPASTQYYAYDLHSPRIQLIRSFLLGMKREPLAYCQDILLQPPEIKADLAFFFKEAHRFDQRQRGCNRAFWLSLPVKKIAVSLPTSSLTGKHDKIEQHQRLVYESIRDLNWPVQEIVLPSEILFIIQKAV